MRRLCIAGIVLLAGCQGYGGGIERMSPAQIKATEGMFTCSCGEGTGPGYAGKATTITANSDDVRKGATAQGKVTITCCAASMTIDTNVGVAQQPGAVTTVTVPATSTTTVVPGTTTTTVAPKP